MIDKLQQWRSSRYKEREERKGRLAEEDAKRQKLLETMQELEETMNELSTEEESQSKKQLSESAAPTPVSVPVQQSPKTQSALPPQQPVCIPVISEGNPILRPIPFKHQVVTSQINNNNPISAFNLSDFEADTSSPFDNMELKTINDLEELAQVLQPSTVTQVPNYYQNLVGTDEHFGNLHHQTMNCQVPSIEQPFNLSSSDKMLNDAKCGVSYQSHVNGFTSNYDYNSVQNYHPQSVIPHHNPHGHVAAYNFIDRDLMPHHSEMSFSYSHQEPQQLPQQQHIQSFYGSNVWPSVSYQQSRPQESFKSIMLNESKAMSSNPPKLTMLSSASVDEASPESDAPISCAAQQLSEIMKIRALKNQPKPSDDSTPENSSSSVQSPTSPIEPDPYQSLHSESQFLVQKIAEMGFPRGRVARACKKLGTNDKKIVEFLLSLQSLLDAGYQEGRAEHALSLLNNDVKAAINFLQVESQLLDLGFPVDRVSEALVKFNCDRDQALEFLIS